MSDIAKISQVNYSGHDYYVSANGNDANDGRTSLEPWQTLGQVNGSTFYQDESIAFRIGDAFYGTLVPPSSGVSGYPITFTSYGSGSTRPIISGTVTPTWTDEGSNYYYCAIAGTDVQGGAWKNGVRLTEVGAKVNLDAADEYWIDVGNSRLYVWSNTGTPSGIEYSHETDLIWIEDLSYITISGLEVFGSSTYLMKIHGATAQRFGIIIDDCAAHGFYDRGIVNTAGWTVDITVQDCIIYDGNPDYGGVEGEGIDIIAGNNVVIQRNTVYNVDHGIVLRWCPGSGVVRYNFVYDTWDDSFYIIDTCAIYYNVGWNAGDDGLQLADGADGSTIYNNTFGDASDGGIILDTDCINCTIKNNIVYNCQRADGETDDGLDLAIYTATGNTLDYNLYYSDGTFEWDWDGVDYNTFNGWKTNSAQDANSPTPADPLFEDESEMDFHLQDGSSGRDAGTDVGLTEDIDGVAVPQEANPAIGAYEPI